MESRTRSRYSWVDFAFSVVGVCTFLLDWGSDLWLAREFYCRGDYRWFGVLVGLLGLSSIVVQMFSWFWFQYDRELPGFGEQASGEGSVFCGERVKVSCLLHVLQLGFLCRHISAIRQGFRVWWRKEEGSEYAVYLTHDLSMLRLIETFCESAPQLTLMIYVMLRTNKARTVQIVSVAASTTSIAWMVVDYHRSLRSFLPDKAKQRWGSSLIYFLWNLLLIGPRVAGLALFSSVLPAFVALHFLLLWAAMALWAWRQRTDFMDSAGGEWLYRATVALIWYFSWFNVAEGRTLGRSLIYHSFISADVAILLATWWSYRDTIQTEAYSLALLVALPLSYLLGLLLKALYYRCFHPRLLGPPDREQREPDDLPDSDVAFRDFSFQDGVPASRLLNQRMARHAAHFYTDQRAAGNAEGGLPLFLFDIVLDVLSAVDFYQEGSYLCLAVLLVLLIGSSVLAQLYSWLWYSYDDFEMKTKVEGFLKPGLGVLHWLQLGIYVRHAAVLETNHWPCSKESELAVYLNHDLSMLRIFETFTESAPQIVLMLTVILQEGKPDLIKVLKTAGSLSAAAFCVTTYHRCMRSFLEEKDKQPIVSSAVYFLWNLLLLSSRIVALALFASVEPCFIFTHFICSWLFLFFCACQCQTEFMESPAGEWLYRATVGLIWYFDWFNVVEGKTRKRNILYHTYILLDICLLCGVWYWKMSSDPPHFEISCLEAAIIGGVVVLVYIVGLVVRILYYQFFHPTLYKTDQKGNGGTEMEERKPDEVDFSCRGLDVSQNGSENVQFRQMRLESSQSAHCNKRMKKLAENFYRRSEGGAV